MERLTTKLLDGIYHIYDRKSVKMTTCCDENNKNCFDFFEGNAVNKLGSYEDAEEQGLLLRLPCKVGDTVWAITSPINLGFDEGEEYEVFECSLDSITFYKTGKTQIRLYSGGVFVSWYVRFSDFGKTVFLTKTEAEEALRKMKGGKRND